MIIKVKFIKKSLFGTLGEERLVTDRAAKQYFALGIIEPYMPEEKEEKAPVETKEEKHEVETKEVKVTVAPKEEVHEMIIKTVAKAPDKAPKKGKKK